MGGPSATLLLEALPSSGDLSPYQITHLPFKLSGVGSGDTLTIRDQSSSNQSILASSGSLSSESNITLSFPALPESSNRYLAIYYFDQSANQSYSYNYFPNRYTLNRTNRVYVQKRVFVEPGGTLSFPVQTTVASSSLSVKTGNPNLLPQSSLSVSGSHPSYTVNLNAGTSAGEYSLYLKITGSSSTEYVKVDVVQALKTNASLSLLSGPNYTAGWTDGQGLAPTLRFVPVEGGEFYCRSGHHSLISSKSMEPCTSGNAQTPTRIIVQDAAKPDGRYLVEAQLRVGGLTVDSESFEYYMHNSLNGAAPCQQNHSDTEIIDKARAYLTTPGTFLASSDLVAPKIAIKNNYGNNFLRTLRRSAFMDSERKFLALKRIYASTRYNHCNVAKVRTAGDRNGLPSCEYLVVNSTYTAVCLKTDRATGDLVFDQYPQLHKGFFWQDLPEEHLCKGLVHTNYFPKTSVPACAYLVEDQNKTLYIPDESLD